MQPSRLCIISLSITLWKRLSLYGLGRLTVALYWSIKIFFLNFILKDRRTEPRVNVILKNIYTWWYGYMTRLYFEHFHKSVRRNYFLFWWIIWGYTQKYFTLFYRQSLVWCPLFNKILLNRNLTTTLNISFEKWRKLTY